MKQVPDVSYESNRWEDSFDDDTESIITNERYVHISSIMDSAIQNHKEQQKLTTSDKIDQNRNQQMAHFQFSQLLCLLYTMYL